MRIFTHSRGVPPRLRASTIRAFMPDKNFTSIGGLEDIIDASYSLYPNATVDLSDCPVSGARLYSGDRYIRDSSGPSGDHAIPPLLLVTASRVKLLPQILLCQ